MPVKNKNRGTNENPVLGQSDVAQPFQGSATNPQGPSINTNIGDPTNFLTQMSSPTATMGSSQSRTPGDEESAPDTVVHSPRAQHGSQHPHHSAQVEDPQPRGHFLRHHHGYDLRDRNSKG